jgi:hypothetical protein
MTWLAAIAFFHRVFGESLLKTSGLWAHDSQFLAEPLVIAAASGVAYHLGIAISGASLSIGSHDLPSPFYFLPALWGPPPSYLAFSSGLVFAGAIACGYVARDVLGSGAGSWTFWVLFKSFQVLPLLVFCQSRGWGLFFLCLAVPTALLLPSKATFLFLALPFVLFFQEGLPRISRPLTWIMIGLVLLTPVAVDRYRAAYSGGDLSFEAMASLPGGESSEMTDTLTRLLHREYAFEAFACVVEGRTQGDYEYGARILDELLHIIPSYLYPDKRIRKEEFPEEFLPMDFIEEAGFTRHILTIFYLDFGVLGCCAGMFIVGAVFGRFYKTARDASLRRRENWPLLLYTSVAMQSHFLAGAGPAFAFTSALGPIVGIALALGIALLLAAPEMRHRRAFELD